MGSIVKSQVILIPLPGQGHIPPMLYLSTKLARLGFTVTIINIDSVHATLQESWKPLPGLDIRLESIQLELHLPNGFDESLLDSHQLFAQAMLRLEEPLTELIKEIHHRGPAVTCVISDYFHVSAPYAAHRAGLRGAALLPGMAAWASVEFLLPKLIDDGYVPVKDGDDDLISCLPGIEVRSQDLPLYLHEQNYKNLGGGEQARIRSKRLKYDSWILVNTVYDFEPETFDAVKEAFGGEFTAIGPLFPLKGDDKELQVSLRLEDMSCLEWLDKQAPDSVLYISFGSISVLSYEQFREIALGLESSNCRYLWVYRPNSVKNMDEEFYESFRKRTSERGLVIKWSPQLEVLQHDSTGGFLTHAGWNSIFESVCAGVPMLGWPCLYDQNMNTKLMLVDKGIGMAFEKGAGGIVSKEEVERKIRSLIEGSEGKLLRRKAAELQDLATKAAGAGGSSHHNFESFVNEVLRRV